MHLVRGAGEVPAPPDNPGELREDLVDRRDLLGLERVAPAVGVVGGVQVDRGA
jgi:hypothetical protein